MDIDIKEIKRLAKLSALEFNDEELENFKKDFSQIAEFVEQVKNADINEQIKHIRVLDITQLREDDVKPSLSQTEILENAPEQGEGAFIVPKVVE